MQAHDYVSVAHLCRVCMPPPRHQSCKHTPCTPLPRYLSWLTSGVSPPAALIERSRIHAAGRCFLQAAADAEHSVRLLFKADIHGTELAQAYACQGAGYLAVQGHADRAPASAAACFLKALDNDQGLLSVQASLEEAVKDLTKEEYDKVWLGYPDAGALEGFAGLCKEGGEAWAVPFKRGPAVPQTLGDACE